MERIINRDCANCANYVPLPDRPDLKDVVSGMAKWRPCSKWLPAENGHYLITVKYETDLYVTCDDYYVYGWDDWGEDVIAWMPLPEPYEEGE